MKKKIIALFLSTILTVSLLASCANNNNKDNNQNEQNKQNNKTSNDSSSDNDKTNDQNTEPEVITAFLPGTDETAMQAYEEIKGNFIANNDNMDFQLTQIPWGDYFTKLNVAFSGGTAPDLFGVGLGQIGPVQGSGNMLELDGYLSDWNGFEDVPQNVLDIGSKDGKLFAMPMLEMRVLWYRTDLFEEAGLDTAPKSLDEIYEYAKKLTKYDENGNIKMSGLEIGTGEQSLFTVMLMHGADTLWGDDLKSNMLEPKALEALKWCNKIMSEKLSDHTIMHDLQGGLFENGLAAMSFSGSNSYVNFSNKIGADKIAVSTLPTEKYMIGCTAWAVYNDTDNPEGAIKMWKEITSKESQLILAEKIGFVPTRKSAKEDYIAKNPDYNNVFYEAASKAQSYGATNKYFFEFVNNIRPLIDEVYYGQKDPKEAMEEFNEKYETAKEAN